MQINVVFAKSSLVKSKIAEYTVNPYLGCLHGCRYCYASMIMQKYHHKGEVWGEFVDVRINTPENVLKELKNKKTADIYLSSMTDCYQPVEEKYQITRKTLINILSLENSLFERKFSVTIQTKSNLVLRDIDILTQFKDITVGITITTLDENFAKIFEPKASTPLDRLKALETLNKYSIKTYAFFGPILPSVSDSFEKMHEILTAIYNAGTQEVIFDKLNYFHFIRGLEELTKDLNLKDAFAEADNTVYIESLRQRIFRLRRDFPYLKFKIVF